jgi:hypothetical protein
MTRDDYRALMQRALDEPHGLKLTFSSDQEFRRARRKLYSLREQGRREGDRRFDNLSVCRRAPETLLIFARDKLPSPIDDGIAPAAASLSEAELPQGFRRPRGEKHRRALPAIWR